MALDEIIRGSTSGNGAEVTTDNALKVVTPTDWTKAGYVVNVNADGEGPEYGDDGRIRTGQEHLLIYDPFDGAALDARVWNATVSTMTMAQSGNYWLLNSGSSVAINTYANLFTTRLVNNWTEFPLYLQWRARVVPQLNAVVEMGLGAAIGTNVACADGVFLRWNAAGVLLGVMSFGGVETTITLAALNPNNYYNFEVLMFEDRTVFDITGNDGVGDQRVEVQIPTGQGGTAANTHMAAFARVFNTGSAPSSAALVYLSSCNLQQMDMAANRPWASQLVQAGRSAHQAPLTPWAQTSTFANGAFPSSAALSNTAAGYTTLGGLYQFAAVAGANTDYALFAYQVPVGVQLAITSVRISAWNTGAAVATTPTLLLWGLGVNSSAVSLATADSFTLGAGFTWGPRRLILGSQSFPIAAAIGQDVPAIQEEFNTPLIVDSGRFLHVILRMPIGTATASQIIQGGVFFHGYFE